MQERTGAWEGRLPADEIAVAGSRGAAGPGTAPADVEATACALGALFDSLLIHLRDRRLLDDADLDEIYEAAIRAHRGREDDPLSVRIVGVLDRMHADGATRVR